MKTASNAARTRTNIVLDDELVAKAMARAKVTTKKAAVEAALRAYVRTPDYSGLLALCGSDVLADDYDPKAAYQSRYDSKGVSFEAHYVAQERPAYAVRPKSATAPKPAKVRAKTIARSK